MAYSYSLRLKALQSAVTCQDDMVAQSGQLSLHFIYSVLSHCAFEISISQEYDAFFLK